MKSEQLPTPDDHRENDLKPHSAEAEPQTDSPKEGATIRLDNFMKLCGLVGTGGQAKLIIQAGEVMVNGEVETRRRRQLRVGDIVKWDEEIFEVEQN